jgi:flagellar motor protein MotB
LERHVIPQEFKNKKVAIIFGKDKPGLFSENNLRPDKLNGFHFRDTPITSYGNRTRVDNCDRINFYWDPSFPVILIKQLHTLRKFYAIHRKNAFMVEGAQNFGDQSVDNIVYNLKIKLLFKSGSTFVEPEGRDALIQLGQVLESEKDLEIVVEGHTDTDKLSSPNSPKNNWELSVLRATSVVEILLANSTMSPAQIMAAGRSEFHPVDVNDKAKNRRIEVIISPNLNELFEIISND